ncbi:MAG: tRNA threonylcarbamoyladenosine biosynthesis protein TsaB [Phycisphaerae bacterium]|nr:tRNA threonylcarbamoyladenosine biosynthesis protein TsaB [Phycisphaerae bacterium]
MPSDTNRPRAVAVETSSRLGSIAVSQGGRILASRAFTQQRRHAVELLPTLDATLAELGWRSDDIDEIYVSAGPGSFTGLRISITFARTMAKAVGCRLVLVPTVHVLAANAPPDVAHLAVVLDAKREQIYTAVFSRPAPGRPLAEVLPVALRTPAEMLAAAPRPLHLLGEGIDYHRDALTVGPDVIELPRDLWPPRAESVCRIGWAMACRGEFTAPQDAIPVYIRKPEAEEVWERRHGRQG